MRALIFFASIVFSSLSLAQVERFQLTDLIEQREPVNAIGNTLLVAPNDIKKVYFFTQITHLAHQQITHRWLYQGQEKAAVTLNIGSDNWRTYSSKQIPAYWPGDWEVQVWYGDLQLLSHRFTVVEQIE